ncbi:MAG: hypothetical protein HZA81_04315 [Candidatus Taylorbacteria bacterium]|nr:hypothetical protein [Candidatus Taylorbacteria bacterium]
MDFTNEQKIYSYKRLSEREKEFLASVDFTSSLRDIGTRHGLLLDGIGKMGDLVFLALTGLLNTSDFPRELGKALGGSVKDLNGVVNELNQSVFLPFRNIAAGTPVEASATPQESKLENLERESLLAEIENPTPSTPPITVDTGGPAVPKEVLEESKKTVANEFIAGKLTETVNLPAQRAQIKPEPTLQHPVPEPPKPKYSADPYREPIA